MIQVFQDIDYYLLSYLQGKITPKGIDYSIVDHRISSNYSVEGATKIRLIS
jgi:hypothetical protein